MIKIVATDLDGTLIPPSKRLPENTFELIEKLHKKGVLFVPASGRQLPNLKKMFGPVLDKIAIIAENGGLVWYKGKIVYSNPTPADKVGYALNVIKGERGLYPLLSCADCAFYETEHKPFIEVCEKSYSSLKRADLSEVAATQTVIKISVWDERPPCAEHGGVVLPPKITGLRTMVSGYDWLDVSTESANKGNALKALLKLTGADSSECMTFGDHMNDLEMLTVSGHPYVTANAFYKLKEIIKPCVGSNAECGVIKRLEQLLNEQ